LTIIIIIFNCHFLLFIYCN